MIIFSNISEKSEGKGMENNKLVETNDNFLRVERIEELMERENYKNRKDFAHDIDMLPQNFSRSMASGKISEKTCEKIIKAFPQYRKKWLMGYDEYPTHNEWADAIQNRKDVTADCMWGVIENSLRKQGKSLKFIHRAGEHVDSSQRLRKDCYYSVIDRDGNELKRLSAREMVEFEQKIQEYCDFMTGKYM